MGTIINCIAIILGGVIGVLAKKKVNPKISEMITKYLGIVIIILAIGWTLTKLVSINNNVLSTNGELLLLVSIIVGGFIGELLRIDDRITNVGVSIENKFKIKGFSLGFLSATLLFGIGAMTILGPIEDAVSGNMTMLIIKSALDFTSSIILGATLGYGVIFSFIPILIIQGSLFLIGPHIQFPIELLNNILLVGYVIILTIGLNLSGVTKLKTANLLPSLFIPIVYYFINILYISWF